MASEIQQWKRSSEPLATRSEAVRRDIDKQLASRESRLRKQAVYKKSASQERESSLLPSSQSSSRSSPQSSPQSSPSNDPLASPSPSPTSPVNDPLISPFNNLTAPPSNSQTTPAVPIPPLPSNTPHDSPKPTLLTVPASSLTAAIAELLAASADRTRLGSHYEDVRELLWALKGTLNKTTGGKTADQDARSLAEMVSCPCGEVKAILRAQIAEQLVHWGCETRETEVCEGMADVLAELMALDHAFIPIVMGVLYRSCPLLIPEVPQQGEETDREFEERTSKYRMSVLLYCSMCKHSTTGGRNPCDLRWVWYLLESINEVASNQVFLEYSGFMEPLLSCAGLELKRAYPDSFGKQMALMKTEILPKLERINGKTTGQIARLEKVMRDLSA